MATYQDVLAAPPHLTAELIDGALVTQPRPTLRHGVAAKLLGYTLTGPFQIGRGGPGGWVFVDEPELRLVGQVVIPDLAGWRRERFPADLDLVGATAAPDWVCEVISPGSERTDKGRKRLIYAEAGISHYWLLDPRAQLLEAFTLEGGRWVVAGVAEPGLDVSLPPFDAITFPFTDLFPFDPPAADQR
jgi:Uma2 family endonuclease